ncbi:MAG: NAD-dependent epimerase/dehydratase family protein, partial [Thermoplasmatales archaeon]
ITKRAERMYIDMVSRRFNKDYLTARLFTPFGYYDSVIRLIPYVILSIINEKDPIVKNPNDGRDFIFINDVAKLFYEVSKNIEIIGQKTVLNFATGKLTRVDGIVSELYSIAGLDPPTFSNDMNVPSHSLFADETETGDLMSKLHIEFSPLSKGLKNSFDWFKNYRKLYSSII